MKKNMYWPLPKAGDYRHKLRLAVIGRKVVLVIPPGMTGVVIQLRKLSESGSVSDSEAEGALMEATGKELTVAWRHYSKLNPHINN
jgi:hypothetical protein